MAADANTGLELATPVTVISLGRDATVLNANWTSTAYGIHGTQTKDSTIAFFPWANVFQVRT